MDHKGCAHCFTVAKNTALTRAWSYCTHLAHQLTRQGWTSDSMPCVPLAGVCWGLQGRGRWLCCSHNPHASLADQRRTASLRSLCMWCRPYWDRWAAAHGTHCITQQRVRYAPTPSTLPNAGGGILQRPPHPLLCDLHLRRHVGWLRPWQARAHLARLCLEQHTRDSAQGN
jgi:hypothetical protein